MDAHIECACCHRQERWRLTDGGVSHADEGVLHEVIVEGGLRRPPGDPRRARALTAIDCVARPVCHVVGDCPACGQLFVSDLPELREMPVVVDTPAGPLRIGGGTIEGPSGRLTPAEARAFVASAWASDDRDLVLSQVLRAPLLAPVFVVIGAWLLGLAFLWVFIASMIQGNPNAS